MDTIEALTTRSTAKSYGDIPPTKDHLATILEEVRRHTRGRGIAAHAGPVCG
jgi:hypothetical protein